MSRNAKNPRHAKPRSSNVNVTLRAGATSGAMGTILLTTAFSPAASAAEDMVHGVGGKDSSSQVADGSVSNAVAGSSAKAADSLQATALQREVRQAEAKAATEARDAAEKAAAKSKAEAREKAASVSRSTERTAVKGSGSVSTLVNYLKAQVGKPYVLGASGPSAFDCSSLTQNAFKQVGVSLPRVSQDQSTVGTPVSMDNLQVGDMLYWGGQGSAYHVGVYVGDGMFIGAQNSRTGVVEKPLSYDPPSGAMRLL
jgi:peptidoglycan DL-endopeptidase CwlO